jgi:RRXRR protein
MAVFVVDQHHRPLMPCSENRARLLLARHRAEPSVIITYSLAQDLEVRCGG